MKWTTFHSQTVKTPQVYVKPEDALQLESAQRHTSDATHSQLLAINQVIK